MNVGEANAVNTLISYLAGQRASSYSPEPPPTAEQARAAAELLARKAYKVLMCGWSPDRLAGALPAGAMSPEQAQAHMLAGFRGTDPASCPGPLLWWPTLTGRSETLLQCRGCAYTCTVREQLDPAHSGLPLVGEV